MPPSRSPNLRLIPDLAAALRRRSTEIELPATLIVRCLLRNDAISPAQLAPIDPGGHSRVIVACSLNATDRSRAANGATRTGLPRNAYLEALVARWLTSGAPLTHDLNP